MRRAFKNRTKHSTSKTISPQIGELNIRRKPTSILHILRGKTSYKYTLNWLHCVGLVLIIGFRQPCHFCIYVFFIHQASNCDNNDNENNLAFESSHSKCLVDQFSLWLTSQLFKASDCFFISPRSVFFPVSSEKTGGLHLCVVLITIWWFPVHHWQRSTATVYKITIITIFPSNGQIRPAVIITNTDQILHCAIRLDTFHRLNKEKVIVGNFSMQDMWTILAMCYSLTLNATNQVTRCSGTHLAAYLTQSRILSYQDIIFWT